MKLSGKIIGIKKTAENAGETYQVRDSFQRFNQKYNMIWQPSWVEKELGKNGLKNVKKNKPGFSVLDWAYLRGAGASNVASGFSKNISNQSGNSWSPIKVDFPEGVEPWQGDQNEAAVLVKKMAGMFGADQVGICKLDRRWVYSHYYDPEQEKEFPIRFSDEQGCDSTETPRINEDGTAVIPAGMKYVIVFLHEMDYDGMKTAPTLTQMAATHLAYSRLSFTAVSMAEFLRGLGYNAIPSANDLALNIPLAVDAGLGQLGRNAKLISPYYGPRCRISKVFTDLPLNIDQPISFGVTEYCQTCKICAESCPAGAIPMGDRSYKPAGNFSHSDVLQWQVDHAACREYWDRTGSNCGMCIAKCPYNGEDGFKHWFGVSLTAQRVTLFNKLLTGMARLPLTSSKDYWESFLKDK